jgi:type IV fimbrial biogenesis protein FimT
MPAFPSHLPPLTAAPRTGRRRRPLAARGFTLIELAIVVAVAAILLGVGTPGMSRSIAARALSAQVAEFIAALRFARSEALKRGVVVTMCAADAASTPPRCQSRDADWRSGWLVFVDRGARGVIGVDDRVLQVQQALAHSGGVPGTRASVSFNAAGISTDASSHYLFNPAPVATGDLPPPVMVCVSKQGRPRIASSEICA